LVLLCLWWQVHTGCRCKAVSCSSYRYAECSLRVRPVVCPAGVQELR
jgi:hypothetical protein